MAHISHSLVQILRGIPDFSTLDEEDLLDIVGESMNLFWKEGSKIFEPGDPGDALYVVINGQVSIRDEAGVEVANSESGSYFGEMSLLLNATHSKSAVAVVDSEIMVVPKEAFTSLLKSHPQVASHFDDVLASRRTRSKSS